MTKKFRCWSPYKPAVRSIETADSAELARKVFAKREKVLEHTVRATPVSDTFACVALFPEPHFAVVHPRIRRLPAERRTP